MMRFLITGIFEFLIILSASGIEADSIPSAAKQKYLKLQFAGNTGFLSFGAGNEFKNNISVDYNLGYLPKHINGIRVITFSVRPAFHLKEFTFSDIRVNGYLGAAVNYSIGRNIYGKIPDYYPPDYYWPNAFRLNPFLGARMGFRLKEQQSNRMYAYTELGTVGYEIWYALKNRNIKITEIWNLAFGIIIQLKTR